MIRGRGKLSRHSERGVALLEALIALAILGLAIVGIVESASGALRGQAMGRAHREATMIADAHLSALVAVPADSLDAYRVERSGATAVRGRSYRWEVQALPVDRSKGLWNVGAAVTWDGGRVVLTSAIFRPPSLLPGGMSR